MPPFMVLLCLRQLHDVVGGVLDRGEVASARSRIGSSNRRDQPLLAIGLEPFRQARRFVGGGGVAARTGCTGSAAGSLPWLVRVVLADPAGVIAGNALDRY